MSDDRLFDEMVRGQHGRELLDNPVFQTLWTDFENQIVRELKRSSPRDADGREKAVLMMQMLEKIKAMVQETVNTGKMAAIQIQSKKTLAEQARQWIGRDGLIRSR